MPCIMSRAFTARRSKGSGQSLSKSGLVVNVRKKVVIAIALLGAALMGAMVLRRNLAGITSQVAGAGLSHALGVSDIHVGRVAARHPLDHPCRCAVGRGSQHRACRNTLRHRRHHPRSGWVGRKHYQCACAVSMLTLQLQDVASAAVRSLCIRRQPIAWRWATEQARRIRCSHRDSGYLDRAANVRRRPSRA